jgi:hypothetical protein
LLRHIKKVYGILYKIGKTIPKSDKLGIHKTIEDCNLLLLEEILSAALKKGLEKIPHLQHARLIVEKIKHLVRIEYDLRIISEKSYIEIAEPLVEISKMIHGWIIYNAEKQNPPKK